MDQDNSPLNVRKNLRKALFKSLLIPLLTLVFFIAAPHWFNHRIRTAIMANVSANPAYSPGERSERLANTASRDFGEIALDCPPGMEAIHDLMVKTGAAAYFQRLRWGFWLSLLLAVVLDVSIWIIFALNERAKNSQASLISSYRLAWRISMLAAIVTLFCLIPLLTYGTFEFSVLATDHFFPKLLVFIVFIGVVTLWKCGNILLKKIPLEFNEPLAREVAPTDAPELWQAVRAAAERLQTSPPDRILIGLQLNFYVTELAVKHGTGRAEGKTLFLSLPLLKQLSEAEVVAIIGHELGHFIGEDTKLTREFYPLRMKARATMIAMARSGWVGWPSFQFMNFFAWCFGETERTASRNRELLADQKAAELTSPQTAARALVRFQVAVEAFQRGLKEGGNAPGVNPLEIPLHILVQEKKFAAEPAFWTKLFEKKLPHPLDTHPPLHIRLEALGQTIGAGEAEAMAAEPAESAWKNWFSQHEQVFATLSQQAVEAVAKLQSRAALVDADYESPAGRELLERHFPEKKWRVLPVAYRVPIALFGLFGFAFVLLSIFVPDLVAKLIFGVLAIVFGTGILVVYQRNHGAELTLTAEGLRHTGWRRPLRFREIKAMAARRVNYNVVLVFQFKTKQPPIWNFSLLRRPVAQMTLPLNGLEGKQGVNAETIFKYFTRQPPK